MKRLRSCEETGRQEAGSHEAGRQEARKHGMGSGVPLFGGRGMSGDVRVPRATNGGFYCGEMLSPGMKWVLPPVDSLVGFHGASNIVGGDGASS
jgi:hypothetical protein